MSGVGSLYRAARDERIVKETIEIVRGTRNRHAPPVHPSPMSTPPPDAGNHHHHPHNNNNNNTNVTSASGGGGGGGGGGRSSISSGPATISASAAAGDSTYSSSSSSSSSSSPHHASLLWIPYVLIALVFIVFLGANFWCYHKKHRERYLRKRDEKRVKDGLHERRRITALMRSHFQTAFMSKHSDAGLADDNHDDDVERRGPVVVDRNGRGRGGCGGGGGSGDGPSGSRAAVYNSISFGDYCSGGSAAAAHADHHHQLSPLRYSVGTYSSFSSSPSSPSFEDGKVYPPSSSSCFPVRPVGVGSFYHNNAAAVPSASAIASSVAATEEEEEEEEGGEDKAGFGLTVLPSPAGCGVICNSISLVECRVAPVLVERGPVVKRYSYHSVPSACTNGRLSPVDLTSSSSPPVTTSRHYPGAVILRGGAAAGSSPVSGTSVEARASSSSGSSTRDDGLIEPPLSLDHRARGDWSTKRSGTNRLSSNSLGQELSRSSSPVAPLPVKLTPAKSFPPANREPLVTAKPSHGKTETKTFLPVGYLSSEASKNTTTASERERFFLGKHHPPSVRQSQDRTLPVQSPPIHQPLDKTPAVSLQPQNSVTPGARKRSPALYVGDRTSSTSSSPVTPGEERYPPHAAEKISPAVKAVDSDYNSTVLHRTTSKAASPVQTTVDSGFNTVLNRATSKAENPASRNDSPSLSQATTDRGFNTALNRATSKATSPVSGKASPSLPHATVDSGFNSLLNRATSKATSPAPRQTSPSPSQATIDRSFNTVLNRATSKAASPVSGKASSSPSTSPSQAHRASTTSAAWSGQNGSCRTTSSSDGSAPNSSASAKPDAGTGSLLH